MLAALTEVDDLPGSWAEIKDLHNGSFILLNYEATLHFRCIESPVMHQERFCSKTTILPRRSDPEDRVNKGPISCLLMGTTSHSTICLLLKLL